MMAARITLRLDRTEFLVLDEALTYYAVDQRYRADRDRDGRRRLLVAVEADRLRRVVVRSREQASGDRLVRLTLTAERAYVLTTALHGWAMGQEAAATASCDDPEGFEDAASVARSLLLEISAQTIGNGG